MISLGRLVLSSVFLLAMWLDPAQPSVAPAEGYAILISYVAFALILLAATWSNWWLDHHLALPAHVVDILVFSVMVFLTEGYTSPFFTFFVFLILSSTIRWSWRETAATAAAVILLFFAVGVAALVWGEGEFELRRLLIRGAYLVVLSLILIWFAQHQRGSSALAKPMPSHDVEAAKPPIRQAIMFAAATLGARRILFLWWEKEEPWTSAAMLNGDAFEERRLEAIDTDLIVHGSLAASCFLFDLPAKRVYEVQAQGSRKVRRLEHIIAPEVAEQFGLERGLAVPIESEEYMGVLFAADVPGLSSDDIAVGQKLGTEISAMLERVTLVKLSEREAVTRTRFALARDLHDSVVQLLAGTSFRLEAIRKRSAAGREIGADIDALQRELSQEQRDLRGFISKLRGADLARGRSDLCPGLSNLTERMSRQWGVDCILTGCGEPALVPADMEHDLHQLVREGVANAVRHGKADRIEISFAASGDEVRLEVADNGCGFPVQVRFAKGDEISHEVGPWSLNERVRSLGGSLALSSGSRGSRVAMTLPMEVP